MKYTRFAPLYDVLSAEPVYRAGRRAGVPLLRLGPGDQVLDVGCGTGLNFSLLRAAVGPSGRIVGVDRSPQMLEQAERRARRRGWGNVRLVRADATALDPDALDAPAGGFDAVLFTYALSLMGSPERAWLAATSVVRPGGRATVVDMQLPEGVARLFSPLARLACALGGADIGARPWTLVETGTVDIDRRSVRGGHIQVRAGTIGVGAGGPR